MHPSMLTIVPTGGPHIRGWPRGACSALRMACAYGGRRFGAMSDPDPTQTHFETVLVGVDGRDGGRDAIALAAQLVEPAGRLILTSVVRPRTAARLGALFADADRRAAAQVLEAARERLAIPASTVVTIHGSISGGLHAVAEARDADLLVVGSTHRGPIGRVMLGDDARQTLEGARCAVAVAPRGAPMRTPWRTIAVGDDGLAESAVALAAARRLAARTGARIRDCAVVGPSALSYGELSRTDSSAALAERAFAEQRRLSATPDVEPEVLEGEPGEALAGLGDEVDLLVIGSRGQGAWGRLMTGSTGGYLVRHASCPVLILPRAPGRSAARGPDGPSPDPRGPALAGA